MHRRLSLLLAVSAISLSAGAAYAAEADATDTAVGELVVTGSRAAPRSRLDTIVPVDTISAQSLQRQAATNELAQALSNLTPSLDFPRPSITDGTDHIRPATLRGLAPDQTLVLINGVRGHVAALVAVNTSIGRGSTSFDLNTIPVITLESVEVLRDGASAQYGSDAIAGVINLRLREARSGGGMVASYGGYHTSFDTSRGSHDADDGETWSVAAWQGLPLGDEGFLTLSSEVARRHPTNRSDFANAAALPLYPPQTVLGRFGDPDLKSYAVYVNAGFPLSELWSFHGYAGYQHRDTVAAATARAYNSGNNVPAVYPLGFLPKIGTKVDDANIAGGFTGEWQGWKIDLSTSYGRNELAYRVLDTINASFGAGSPTEFYAGKLAYDQLVSNLSFDKAYDVGLAGPLNVAFGAEYRHEGFRISPGEPLSYTVGPDTTKAGVSQGFPGFRPSNSINAGRHNWSAYLDLEGKLTEGLSFGVAGRWENYSDFGNRVTGKASARYDFNEMFALRGAVSTGFRAPALQQQFFTYTSTNNVILPGGIPGLIEIGTFPVASPIAVALGAQPLEPETSVNYSVGVVFRTGGFELTVDGYRIDLSNRIVLSENLPNSATPPATAAVITALLAPFGVSGARFFINGVDTTTQGVDIVARYRFETDSLGRFDLTGAANFNRTEVTKTPSLPSLVPLPSPAFVFDRANRLTFEEGTPERKLVGTIDWTYGPAGATLRVTNYDSVLIPNNTASFDYETGDATLVDLEGRYRITEGLTLALGANNIFDEYPNFTPGVLNTTTGSVGFPSFSPFGFNGRFFYGRVNINW